MMSIEAMARLTGIEPATFGFGIRVFLVKIKQKS